MPAIDSTAVRAYLLELQTRLCGELEAADGGARFRSDRWTRAEGGGGDTRVLEDGGVFEKVGVAFSHVTGASLPAAATARKPQLASRPYEAMGVSVVIHPRNPFVPTAHMNVRFLRVRGGDSASAPKIEKPSAGLVTSAATESSLAGGQIENPPAWWFGGGFDLTPCYGFAEDAVHWHRTAAAACAPFGAGLYARLKAACDEYFFLRHRNEPRGIGGVFFDDFTDGGFDAAFDFTRSVGDHFAPAYLPIVERRKNLPWSDREREFQLYRRGRYVEFNLVWDRGTLFGLQSGGRTESILMSLPPRVSWRYDRRPEAGSAEERLYTEFLKPRDWLNVPT